VSHDLRRFDITDDHAAILQAIEEDGGVIVHNFISGDLLTHLRQELKPPGMEGGVVKQIFSGAQTKRFSGIARRAPSYAEVIDHDLFHAWAVRSFKSDYWLNTGQAMIVGPGSSAQFLHRDCANWPVVRAAKDGPEATISSMLALSDFTAENGATQVAPGSHRWDDYERTAEPSEIVQAVMPAGSALLYSGRTVHSAGANVTGDQWRFGLHTSFLLGQLTPEEALTVTVPWSIAQTFSARVQHMLGYYSHRVSLPDFPSLWTSDYRELRESLSPAPSADYVSAGGRLGFSKRANELLKKLT